MFRALLTTLLLLLTLASTHAAEARCAMSTLAYTLLTPSDTTLPLDARLIATHRSTHARDASSNAPPTLISADGQATIALDVAPLGPGIVSLTPAERPTPGVWTVTGLAAEASVTYADVAMPEPPEAPKVESITAALGEHRGRLGRSHDIQATLASPIPEKGVLAVIAVWGEDDDELHERGVSAVRTDAFEQRDAPRFYWPGRCSMTPPGYAFPDDGVVARVYVVNACGQASALSEPVMLERHDAK